MSRSFDTVAASLKNMAAGLVGIAAVQTLTRATTARHSHGLMPCKEASKRVGIGVEQMQRLQRAGELTNVSHEQITGNLEKFARGLGDAAKGTGTLKDCSEAHGYRTTRCGWQPADPYCGVSMNMLQLSQMPASEQEALSLAVAGFGRSGAGFVTTLEEMQAGLNKFDVLTENKSRSLANMTTS